MVHCSFNLKIESKVVSRICRTQAERFQAVYTETILRPSTSYTDDKKEDAFQTIENPIGVELGSEEPDRSNPCWYAQ